LGADFVTITALSPAPDVAVLGNQGGEVGLDNGRVKLAFPAGVFTETVRIRARVLERSDDTAENILRTFEFAVEGRGGREQHTFTQPLTLTVTYPQGAVVPQAFALRDEDTGEWLSLPTTLYTATNTLVASVPHLSLIGEDDGHKGVELPTTRGVGTDLFSGAAQIQYPIPVPFGAGGLTPQVALQFDSRSRSEDRGNSSVVGSGWRLIAGGAKSQTAWIAGSNPPVWQIESATFDDGNGDMRQAPEWKTSGQGDYISVYNPD